MTEFKKWRAPKAVRDGQRRQEEIALRRQRGGREELGRRHAEDPPGLPGVPAGSLLQDPGLGVGGVRRELARSAGQEQT